MLRIKLLDLEMLEEIMRWRQSRSEHFHLIWRTPVRLVSMERTIFHGIHALPFWMRQP